MKVAVIGAGSMGRNHARVYADLSGVDLVGICDENEPTALATAKRHGARAFTDPARMLDEIRPDAVSVCVPTELHLAVASEAIARKIHVLVEKPIAETVEQGSKLIAAASAAGVTLMVGHIERFNPAVIALRERLSAGELGDVFQIDARRQGPFPSRIMDVGVVVDLAVHDIDIVRYVSGQEVVRLFAETAQRVHSKREDLLVALLRLSKGSIGSLSINWLTPTKVRTLTVTGERGMFVVDYLTQDLWFYENATAHQGDWDALQRLTGVSEGRTIRHIVPKREPLREELAAFVATLRGERSLPVTGEDGLRALELAQALLKSASEQGPVTASV